MPDYLASIWGIWVYWSAHKGRKDAEPLVRFLRKALIPSANRSKPLVRAPDAQTKLRLILNDDYLEGPVTQETIHDALMRVGNRDFMIIESGPQDYLQTASRDEGYILEVRKGGPGKHYQAVRNGRETDAPVKSNDTFTFEEISEAMSAYLAGSSMPGFLRLQPLELLT